MGPSEMSMKKSTASNKSSSSVSSIRSDARQGPESQIARLCGKKNALGVAAKSQKPHTPKTTLNPRPSCRSRRRAGGA